MIDFTGIPTPSCPNCGSPRFATWIIIDPEDYEIAMYGTDGKCADCDTKYSIATPLEHPDILEQEMQIEKELKELREEEDDEY